jgi:hypothetical protein
LLREMVKALVSMRGRQVNRERVEKRLDSKRLDVYLVNGVSGGQLARMLAKPSPVCIVGQLFSVAASKIKVLPERRTSAATKVRAGRDPPKREKPSCPHTTLAKLVESTYGGGFQVVLF